MIRLACIEDSARMAEINVFCWRSSYRGIISDEFLFKKLLVHKRLKAFEKDFENNNYESYVYEDKEIVKAFMSIGKCRNQDKNDAFELWGLYVDPVMKNSGIGTTMIKYCEEIARNRGFKENTLWVLKENISAIEFYKKMGYEADGKEEYIELFNAKEVRYFKELK